MVPVRGVLVATLVVALAGCQSSGSPKAAPPSSSITTAGTGTATSRSTVVAGTTTAPPQTSGPRTVLSAVGINVRSQPSKTASVLGTAAQGSTLTVLAHSDQGWYQVKGATVTGWISDSAKLSAPGKFKAYSSSPLMFTALYPETWTVAEVPPASVAFHPPSGNDSIVASLAATAALLGRGRAGYRQTAAEQMVVCGVTGDLVIFTQAGTAGAASGGVGAEQYLAQLHLTLDPQHALGIDGNLADLAQVQTVRDFANSLTFPFPQCEGGAASTTSVP